QRFFDESERGLVQAERASRVLSETAQDTAAAMNQITASIATVESGTDDAMNQSRESTRQAETGVELARDVVAAFEGIRENSLATAESVRFLSERVLSIETILAVISDIANQTKLLSLNASIIAAQAGEHGRGFLVVADEIKALAAKTAGSTKEIADVISEVQGVAHEAIQVAERSMKRVELEVRRVDHADEALTAIRESSSVLEDVIRRIGYAMSEQSRSAAQVNRSMQEVHTTSGSVGGLVGRQLESGRNLKHAMTDVVRLLEQTLVTSREKAESARVATDSLMTMFEQLERVREANAEQGELRDSVLQAVAQLRGLSARNRESAKILASAVDNVTSKVRGLAEVVAEID
ncbi:MAG: methyl-accepting chemotaxis protein, partial [Myxococcota bacterium]